MRHVRTTVTMCVLIVVFLVGTVIGFKLLTAEAPSLASDADAPTCEPRTIESGSKLAAGQVTVNVFNATNRSGLATRTLNDLQKRGFLPGEIGNAPGSVKKFRNVVIATDDRKSAAVRLVRKQFKGKVKIRKPKEEVGDGVRVLVGRHFKGVKKKAKKSITAKKPTEICVLVDPAVSDATK